MKLLPTIIFGALGIGAVSVLSWAVWANTSPFGAIVRRGGYMGVVVAPKWVPLCCQYTGKWTPSSVDVARFEKRLAQYVLERRGATGPTVSGELDRYRRTYWGLSCPGMRHMVVMGGHRDLFPYRVWRSSISSVIGGGDLAWCATYDMATDAVLEFHTNGPR